MTWPAWAMTHFANLFFSGVVNVPHGANLLSNTSGTLVGVVLSPVTWLFGPVTATNVALTLAPAVSAWGLWLAVRPFVSWKPAAIPAALVFGYSAALVTSLAFGHVSVTVLAVPPLLFTTLYEILVRQEKSAPRDGLHLAALVVVQFLISPEVLVMCAFFAVIGIAACAAVGWRKLRARLAHAGSALLIGTSLALPLLAYPAWYGLAGSQSVSGVLFAIAPLTGVPFSGYLLPGHFEDFANSYVRFVGYLGRNGPPPNYLGLGVEVGFVASLVVAHRRRIVWLLLSLTAVTMWISLGAYLFGGPPSWERIWLPWRYLSNLSVLKEILPAQFAPFLTLFVAFALAIGLDALYLRFTSWAKWTPVRCNVVSGLAAASLTVAALVPVFVTFDMPFTVVSAKVPLWMAREALQLPGGTVLLTVPVAVSGSPAPMLWQAVDGMHFRLAGAAMKTPNASGGPVGQGEPGSARRILSDLSVFGTPQPLGTIAQVNAVRRALREWRVNEVVIDGVSRDPTYASGFLTMVFGSVPSYVDSALVWKVPARGLSLPPAIGASLYLCRLHAGSAVQRHHPLYMARCVLTAAEHH